MAIVVFTEYSTSLYVEISRKSLKTTFFELFNVSYFFVPAQMCTCYLCVSAYAIFLRMQCAYASFSIIIPTYTNILLLNYLMREPGIRNAVKKIT